MTLFAALLLAAAPARAIWPWFGPKADSRWRDRMIVVDGDESDWKGVEQGEDTGLSFAFLNDALDLFIFLAPHSRIYRNELAGFYEQDFTVWLDARAGMDKKIGLRLKAPAGGSPDAPRDFVLVKAGDAAPGNCESAELKLGPINEHGVLEARVPLACFGATPDKTFTVGFEAGTPKQPPPKKPGQHFDRLYVWVKVKPSGPPKQK